MDNENQFAANLRKARKEKMKNNSKWTQEYVADKIGVARTTYTAYERGTKTPPLVTVSKLATLLEVTIDELVHGKRQEPDYRRQAKEILDDPNALIAGRDGNPDPEETLDLIEELLRRRDKGK